MRRVNRNHPQAASPQNDQSVLVAGHSIPLVIIGAGPAGLGAAIRWRELQPEGCLVLEANAWPGGLASSFLDEAGFTWDLGSHLQFSHYHYYDQVLARATQLDDWFTHTRVTDIWFDGTFMPYPFQLNLHRLRPELRWECVRDLLVCRELVSARRNGVSRKHSVDHAKGAAPRHDGNGSSDQTLLSFEEWCEYTFGLAVTKHFLRPYNKKLWGCGLDEMNASWIAERVAVPELQDVLRSICLNEDSSSWGPNSTFRYPKAGGSGFVWDSVAKLLPAGCIQFNTRVVGIDLAARRLTLSSGQELSYEHCVSTIPLTQLYELLQQPAELSSIQALRSNSTLVVGVGLKGQPCEALQRQCWSYFPQPDIPFYRLTVMSNLSPHNVPVPNEQWSVLTETTTHQGSSDELAAQCRNDIVRSLIELGFIRSSDIVSVWHRALPAGYPIPTLGRDAVLAEVLPWLEAHQFYSRGRFGAWKYEVSNQDHCFMQGVEAVERILQQATESTLSVHRKDRAAATTRS